MIRITRGVLFGLLSSVLFSSATYAATRTAASCNASDVQTALNAATAGDTVAIPAGTCTWTTGISWTAPANVTLQGAGSQSTLGGGDATVIIDNINRTSSDPGVLDITPSSSGVFRMTGITFESIATPNGTSYNGLVRFGGTSSSPRQIRIDHCHFYHINLIEIVISGWIYGVIDHCLFDMSYGSEMSIKVEHSGWNNDSAGNGDQSWADTSHFGSSQFVFVEDNQFQMAAGSGNHGFAFDCIFGGRFVFRYNTVGYHVAYQTHGQSGDIRACRAMEIYNNTTTWSSNPNVDYFAFLLMLEGGSGMFWDNTVTGFQQVINADVIRTNNLTYPQTPPPNGWGYCGTGLGPSAWDGNTNSTGYPCIDQVGRGKGDLLTGLFPNKKDSVTGTITWPNQVSDPWYVWGITYNAPPDVHDTWWSNSDSVTVENRDYYLQLPNYKESATFNGTAGVGRGLLSARPATCTPYVGYWATDASTLYQCSAPNTWTTYYTPYIYPHPLTQGTVPSAPPTNLQVH